MFSITRLVSEIDRLSAMRLQSEMLGGAEQRTVVSFAPLESAGEMHVAFLAQSKYREAAKNSKAGVLVLTAADKQAIWGDEDPGRALIVTRNPYAWFAWALQVMTARDIGSGSIDPRAIVAEGAVIAPTAVIEAGAVIGRGAVIGERTHIWPGAFIGENVKIGDDAIVYPNATIYHGCKIGNRVILHSGSVIGADGFGFAPFAGEWVKIPQVGAVTIEDDVEIGANTTIDRGALQDTFVGRGSKIDNQIQLGHNCRVGSHSVMAACTGVAGSTSIGSHCMIGGAANINGHISIPDQTVVGPATTVVNWPEGTRQLMGMFPSQERRAYEKTAVLIMKLPEMRKTIKALQAEIAELKAKLQD